MKNDSLYYKNINFSPHFWNYKTTAKKLLFGNCAKDLCGDHNFDLVTPHRFPGRGHESTKRKWNNKVNYVSVCTFFKLNKETIGTADSLSCELKTKNHICSMITSMMAGYLSQRTPQLWLRKKQTNSWNHVSPALVLRKQMILF